MGALVGACLLGIGGAFLASEIYGSFEGAAAMGGLTLGALVGGLLGFLLALWAILRKGGASAGKVVAILTAAAAMVLVCFAFVAFS